MSDIYVPGVKSRFNTEKLIEDLMKVERVPKERAEKNIERLKTEKTYWQDIGRRIGSLRDSARLLYSFQNPFNDRVARSSDESLVTGTATREAVEQERFFTIKQIAQADRFLSSPLEESFKVEAGTYSFSAGKNEISFTFRGGSLREFTEALNRRGRDKIQASLIAVKPGTKSLLIESVVTGAENRLGFSGDAESLAIKIGMVEKVNDSRRNIGLSPAALRPPPDSQDPSLVSVADKVLKVGAGASASIPLTPSITPSPAFILKFETATERRSSEADVVPQAPPGPSVPSGGSVTYGGITIENDSSSTPIPLWVPPEPPKRVDDMRVLSLTFSDGTAGLLPPLEDSEDFSSSQYRLMDISGGKTIVSVDLVNKNTHRDISIRNIEFFDPNVTGGVKPRNPVSTAQDAALTMDGIEISRSQNLIDDLIPGVTVTLRGASDRPVQLEIEPDREAIKDAVISLTGNYNRLMAEINVLTRNDDRVVQELSYLSTEEQEELRKRLGAFSGDSTLNQFKSSLQRIASTPYPTSAEQELALLTQIGIGTDVRRAGASSGYDPSRLRGYLEIDEKALDMALETKLSAIQQLFGFDSDGDLIVDSGVAYALENISRPYVESGGLIALKSGTADSRINQEERRIETMDRQLANKEASLKSQYGQMEGAYNRMERMSTSLDQFSQQNNNNR
jgi:flagellar hook-associated protein 2